MAFQHIPSTYGRVPATPGLVDVGLPIESDSPNPRLVIPPPRNAIQHGPVTVGIARKISLCRNDVFRCPDIVRRTRAENRCLAPVIGNRSSYSLVVSPNDRRSRLHGAAGHLLWSPGTGLDSQDCWSLSPRLASWNDWTSGAAAHRLISAFRP
ncbi:hypothetical protein LZ30DRAFT_684958 [Colletotrichum cereale]|nr:hypothetical protein LZ30DRAFT_684958 [Colletotrichum cereale]